MAKYESDEELILDVQQKIPYTRQFATEPQIEMAVTLAGEYILSELSQYHHLIDIPQCFTLLFEVAVWRLQEYGVEGLSSETYNGMAQTLRQSVPTRIRRLINSKKKVGTVW